MRWRSLSEIIDRECNQKYRTNPPIPLATFRLPPVGYANGFLIVLVKIICRLFVGLGRFVRRLIAHLN
jgi:hypothetical protein